MKSGQAATFWLNYHKTSSKDNTIRTYEELGQKFYKGNGDKDLTDLNSDDVLNFLNIKLCLCTNNGLLGMNFI